MSQENQGLSSVNKADYPAAPQAAGVGERDAFEAWYCADAKASCGLEMEASDIAKLRDGDAYGDRLALNSKWEGWQGRALRTPSREPEGGAVECILDRLNYENVRYMSRVGGLSEWIVRFKSDIRSAIATREDAQLVQWGWRVRSKPARGRR